MSFFLLFYLLHTPYKKKKNTTFLFWEDVPSSSPIDIDASVDKISHRTSYKKSWGKCFRCPGLGIDDSRMTNLLITLHEQLAKLPWGNVEGRDLPSQWTLFAAGVRATLPSTLEHPSCWSVMFTSRCLHLMTLFETQQPHPRSTGVQSRQKQQHRGRPP